jgi:glycerate-2-kinase
MADKGFDLKVLIPTDDGITVSLKGIEKAPYYLFYNVSKRSYQLAGKVKTFDYFNNTTSFVIKFNELIVTENIDKIINNQTNASIKCDFVKADFNEIGEMLDDIIDKIDKKEELI